MSLPDYIDDDSEDIFDEGEQSILFNSSGENNKRSNHPTIEIPSPANRPPSNSNKNSEYNLLKKVLQENIKNSNMNSISSSPLIQPQPRFSQPKAVTPASSTSSAHSTNSVVSALLTPDKISTKRISELLANTQKTLEEGDAIINGRPENLDNNEIDLSSRIFKLFIFILFILL